jgi:hypothetical protein
MRPTLNKLYTEGVGALGGFKRLYTVAKQHGYTRKAVKDYLAAEPTYTLHKPLRNKFTRSRVLVGGIDQQWQADLVDMQKYKTVNNNYRFLLTVIDIFSKHAWVIPLKDKYGQTVTAAFAQIFSAGRKPVKLQTDAGKEFFNRYMVKLVAENNVYHFATKQEMKASVVERFNRTLKADMWRYFTSTKATQYLAKLPDLVNAYNHRYHSSIRMAPVAVTAANSRIVKRNLYGKQLPHVPAKLKIGDVVRISLNRNPFAKGYERGWTIEVFTVKQRLRSRPPRYLLQDLMDDDIDGSFYQEELQKVTKPVVFDIERVIKRRGDQMLVKWVGYDKKFNQWIGRGL